VFQKSFFLLPSHGYYKNLSLLSPVTVYLPSECLMFSCSQQNPTVIHTQHMPNATYLQLHCFSHSISTFTHSLKSRFHILPLVHFFTETLMLVICIYIIQISASYVKIGKLCALLSITLICLTLPSSKLYL
jgi:hypothetical protein